VFVLQHHERKTNHLNSAAANLEKGSYIGDTLPMAEIVATTLKIHV